MSLTKQKLYNPEGDDSDKRLISGNPTGIINLADISKPIYLKLFKTSFSNNWIPETVSNMSRDKIDYENVLSISEREVYDDLLSFLTFMDSLQTKNLPNIGKFITLADALLMINRQTFDENLHAYSYGYTLQNVMDKDAFNKLIYRWRDNKVLRERNEYIANIYEENKDKDTKRAFLILLIANYILEGVYFYTGFNFFHNLAYRGLMKATNTQIKYIKRDELVHCTFFKNLIEQFKEENPDDWDEDLVYDMFKEAVAKDLEFNLITIGDKVMGMNKQSIEDYTYFNANKRLEDIKLIRIFKETENPYKHLDMIASIEDETTTKSGSFEVTSIAYKQANAFKGWTGFEVKRLHKRLEKETNPEEIRLIKLEIEAQTELYENEFNKTDTI